MGSFRFRRTDPHTLAGAYALDALGASDRARFERHLSGCPACAQEARGLQEATARLSDTLATQPPDGMRERVMAAAARTRQNPPVLRPARATPWPGRRWGIAVACGVLAIALVVGGLAFHMQQQLNQDQSRSRAIAAVLNAPDAAMMTVAASSTQGSGTIVMSHQAHALVFDLDPSTPDLGVVRTTALELRKVLSADGLVPFVKSTGSRGLHVTVPLDRSADIGEVRASTLSLMPDGLEDSLGRQGLADVITYLRGGL